jgi:hypothetical protein
MIVLKMLFAAQTHHAQCRCNSPFNRREDCPYQQRLCLLPNAFREQFGKGFKYRDIFCLQGWQRLPLVECLPLLTLLFVNVQMDKVQLRECFLSGWVRLANDQIHPNLPGRPQVYRMATYRTVFFPPPTWERPRKWELWQIVNAILYVVRTGCQ